MGEKLIPRSKFGAIEAYSIMAQKSEVTKANSDTGKI